MGFFRLFRAGRPAPAPTSDERGVALFIVLAAVAILGLLVIEFTYVAQVNQRIAYDAADQLKAQYLAKSGFKLSLLRLKAFQNAKTYVESLGQGSSMVPKGILDAIWSFPFRYPIPTELLGSLSPIQKDTIHKFEKNSSLSGDFSALIESESNKFNLNMVLAPFAAAANDQTKAPDKNKAATPPPAPDPNADADGDGIPDAQETQDPNKDKKDQGTPFSPEQARDSLRNFVKQIFQNKSESDEDFQEHYNGFDVDGLVDGMIAWIDRKFEPASAINEDTIKLKQAPFFDLSELHMVPNMEDSIYDLLAPHFTVSPTPGVNVNTIKKDMLKVLVPEITADESKEFFEFRDSKKEDNLFKTPQDFLTYLQNNVGFFRNSESAVQDWSKSLTDRGIRLVTDETQFKIEVLATVNNTSKALEAWVTLKTKPKDNKAPGTNPAANPAAGFGAAALQPPGAAQNPEESGPPLWQGAAVARPDTGLKITFMRIY